LIVAGVASLLVLAVAVVYTGWYLLVRGTIQHLQGSGRLIGLSRSELEQRFGRPSFTADKLGWHADWTTGVWDIDTASLIAVRFDDSGRVIESGHFVLNTDVPGKPMVMGIYSFHGQNVAGQRTRVAFQQR
jgi:hypothetical protein